MAGGGNLGREEAAVIMRAALEAPAKKPPAAEDGAEFRDRHERAVATWVMTHGREAGHTTATLSAAASLYIPLQGTRGALGVLAVKTPQLKRALTPVEKDQLTAFAHQTALALERALLAGETEKAARE